MTVTSSSRHAVGPARFASRPQTRPNIISTINLRCGTRTSSTLPFILHYLHTMHPCFLLFFSCPTSVHRPADPTDPFDSKAVIYLRPVQPYPSCPGVKLRGKNEDFCPSRTSFLFCIPLVLFVGFDALIGVYIRSIFAPSESCRSRYDNIMNMTCRTTCSMPHIHHTVQQP